MAPGAGSAGYERIVSHARRLMEDREALGLDTAHARALLRSAEEHVTRVKEKRRALLARLANRWPPGQAGS